MADALGVALFLFVASLVQGFLGFGFGIVAIPHKTANDLTQIDRRQAGILKIRRNLLMPRLLEQVGE